MTDEGQPDEGHSDGGESHSELSMSAASECLPFFFKLSNIAPSVCIGTGFVKNISIPLLKATCLVSGLFSCSCESDQKPLRNILPGRSKNLQQSLA
jgi:hypothetical protein